MNINIRESIKNNFKSCTEQEIIESIDSSIHDQEEITLPGLGVFFEIIWKNSSNDLKNNIIQIIKKNI